MDGESFPQYLRIAMDIASLIVKGEFREEQKLSGRSMLSSRYNVSPETIRKAVRLLADMEVVDVKEKSGAVIRSAKNAARFLDGFRHRQEQQQLKADFRDLLQQQAELSKQISEAFDKLLQAQRTPLPADQRLPNYEATVPPHSNKIGATIGSLQFWRATGATIIAIRRNQNTILSPGPFAELCAEDVLVFVGTPASAAAVEHFLDQT